MGLPVAAILKGADLVLAGLQVADKVLTKVKRWNKTRKADAARKKRLIEEINKS
jgi:hypothetical protein